MNKLVNQSKRHINGTILSVDEVKRYADCTAGNMLSRMKELGLQLPDDEDIHMESDQEIGTQQSMSILDMDFNAIWKQNHFYSFHFKIVFNSL